MKKILYLSPIDWFWIKQRPQHICEGLSEKHDITFFCKQSWRGNQLVHINNSNNAKFVVKKNLRVIRKKTFPLQKKISIMKKANKKYLTRYLNRLDAIEGFDFVIISNPNDINYLSDNIIKSKKIIYDCMDNYTSFPGSNVNEIAENEAKLIALSDIIIVSSNDLLQVIKKYDVEAVNKSHVINNGVDFKTFDIEKYKSIISEPDSRKRVSYIGTISEWVDIDLIKNFAVNHKNVDFHFYGPIDKSIDLNKYNKVNNIYFNGVKPYNEIPEILHGTDVAIMPFKINDLVKSVNPVKIYEYLAMGKPVLATKYEETDRFGDLINTYENEQDFNIILDEMLSNDDSDGKVFERVEFARTNSWERRVETFHNLINKLTKEIV